MRRSHKSEEDSGFAEFVVDQLGALPDIRARRMFGGHGLYAGGTFFGIVAWGRLYFRVSAADRMQYAAWGMRPFTPSKKQVLRSYFEVPPERIEEREALVELAAAAVKAAEDGRGKKGKGLW